MTGIGAVFFDVGGTLIEPWPSVGAVYARVAQRHGLDSTVKAMDLAFGQVWAAKRLASPESGRLTVSSKHWWRNLVFEVGAELGWGTDPAVLDPWFEDLYAEFAQPSVWRLDPDARPVIASLRTRGLHVGVISNWDCRLRSLLDAFELGREFSSITVSCEVGAEKPAAGIFEAAVPLTGFEPGQALHVGDSFLDDVQGARAAGLQAALIDRSGAATQDCLRLRGLMEVLVLPALVKSESAGTAPRR